MGSGHERGRVAMGQQNKMIDSILQRMDDAKTKYHRLVLLVGRARSGKTSALQAVHSRVDAPIHNVGVELSRLMLELSEKERSTRLSRLLAEATDSPASDVVLLDNIELLFDPKLQANPLELLKALSKTRTVVTSWQGHVEGDHMIYAKPGHPEYRRYDVDDLLIVETDSSQL